MIGVGTVRRLSYVALIGQAKVRLDAVALEAIGRCDVEVLFLGL